MYSYAILLLTFCHLVFSSPAPSVIENTTATQDAMIKDLINRGYIITRGIGAHKYHRMPVVWNDARKICISEGAHLAVINSRQEELIINRYRSKHQLSDLWIGYHDQFQKDDWVTLHDQDIHDIGYLHWAEGEPNNGNGNERCVTSVNKGGMNDLDCGDRNNFVCKIYLDHHHTHPSSSKENTANIQ